MASELLGVAELIKKLEALPLNKQKNALRAAGRAAAKPVVELAKSRIPENKIKKLHKVYTGRYVAPGFAQRSVAAKVFVPRQGGAVFVSIGVKREAYYAINFVELRTSKNEPDPWLVPSFKDTQSQQLTALSGPIKKHIEKVRNGGK